MRSTEKSVPSRLRIFYGVQKEVEKGKFRNRSHAIEYGLLQLMENEKKE